MGDGEQPLFPSLQGPLYRRPSNLGVLQPSSCSHDPHTFTRPRPAHQAPPPSHLALPCAARSHAFPPPATSFPRLDPSLPMVPPLPSLDHLSPATGPTPRPPDHAPSSGGRRPRPLSPDGMAPPLSPVSPHHPPSAGSELGPASSSTAPRVHGRAFTYRPPAADAGHPRPRPPAQLPPSPPRKRRVPALPGDGAHPFRVPSAVSGSARLFPDQPRARGPGRSWGLIAEPGPKISESESEPGRGRPAPPRLLSWAALFEKDACPSNPEEVVSSKAFWRFRVTWEGLLRLHLLRDACRPQPKEGEVLAVSAEPRSQLLYGPLVPFRRGLAHVTANCGRACLHLRPGGASLGARLGRLHFSGRRSPAESLEKLETSASPPPP